MVQIGNSYWIGRIRGDTGDSLHAGSTSRRIEEGETNFLENAAILKA